MTPGASSPPSPTAETPLLPREAAVAEEGRKTAMDSASSFKNDIRNNAPRSPYNTSEHGPQFYDPAAILNVPRELAFGYLILLTGGAAEYAPPPAENSRGSPQSPHSPRSAVDRYAPSSSDPDEESATLAYAAIVDGNVLHACFGLKASASGRISVPAIGGRDGGGRSLSSLFCCFPASSGALDALQLVLPHLSGNKVRMADLVEMLREVRDLHHEGASRGGDVAASYAAAGEADATTAAAGAKAPLYVRVVRAYVGCFAAVVGYHDARGELAGRDDAAATGDGAGGARGGGIAVRCRSCLARRPTRVDPRLETLRADALREISTGFRGLGEDIWQSLENAATESAVTTGMSSVEGSTSSVERGGKR